MNDEKILEKLLTPEQNDAEIERRYEENGGESKKSRAFTKSVSPGIG
jgi:hypothetical protein